MRSTTETKKSKKILLTAGRSPLTLDLARLLHAGGHEVYVADTFKLHLCTFSNSVKKSFKTPSARDNSKAFIDRVAEIADSHKIDMIIPMYEEILYLAKERHRLPASCQLFSQSFEEIHALHNKWLFNKKLESLGFDIPETHLVHNSEELKKIPFTKPYALKAVYSRASHYVKKVIPPKPAPTFHIDAQNPWIAQEWLEGKKYCTYSICQNGNLVAHAAYPVNYAIDGNSCITFEAIEHKKILAWIEKFAKEINFTGHFAFDFIETQNGKLYAIECNPRATSGLHLFKKCDKVDRAYVNATSELIQPKHGTHKQLAMGMMMYGWRRTSHPNNSMRRFFKAFLTLPDVSFSFRDMKPFLLNLVFCVNFWLQSRKKKLSIPEVFTYDNEWNGER